MSEFNRPRIGCTSWAFHGFEGGTNPEAAIDIIGEIGFEGIELILLAPEDIDSYWNAATLERLKHQLQRHRLQLPQFVLFQPVVQDLTSTDPDKRARSLDNFEAGCRIGRELGAPIINIVAPWPREMRRPGGGYLPRYYDLPEAHSGDKFSIEMEASFDWQALWATYIETTRACLERAKAHDMKLSIEHHTHTMIPDAAHFLLLWNAIPDPDLGYNLDIGWTLSQREYPAVAIHKTRAHLMNLHVRDIDGLMRQFVHIGMGVMDFEAVADALQAVGFQGFVSLEQDKPGGDMHQTGARYLDLMKDCLNGA